MRRIAADFAAPSSTHTRPHPGFSTGSTGRIRIRDLAIFAAIVIALVAGAWYSRAEERPLSASPAIAVQVTAGDTPWSLAEAHPISGLSVAQEAAMIQKVSSGDRGVICVGQTIFIPVDSDGAAAVAMR